jgi:hypothetical protein
MSIEVTKNGIIKIIQGDTGSIIVDGVPTDKNYDIYFAIRKKDRTLVAPELKFPTEFKDTVEIPIDKELSEKLEVPLNAMCEVYFWGVKLCDAETGNEDTMRVGECSCGGWFGKWNRIYAYPKIVEGIVDESKE